MTPAESTCGSKSQKTERLAQGPMESEWEVGRSACLAAERGVLVRNKGAAKREGEVSLVLRDVDTHTEGAVDVLIHG
jgi:hypothetical protein